MKKIICTLFMIGLISPIFGQTKKKHTYKKPIKKSYTKKAVVKKSSSMPLVQESKPYSSEVQVQEHVEPQSLASVQVQNESVNDNERYIKVSDIITKKGGYIKNRNSQYSKGILAFFKGVYTNDNKIYFLLEFKNSSNIDYDIESVFFNTSPVKKRKDNLELEERNFIPIWDNQISTIPKKSWQKLVFTFDKFTLNDEKILNVTVREKEGEREINLVVYPKQISNAEYIRL